jgi:hypothetical protein
LRAVAAVIEPASRSALSPPAALGQDGRDAGLLARAQPMQIHDHRASRSGASNARQLLPPP